MIGVDELDCTIVGDSSGLQEKIYERKEMGKLVQIRVCTQVVSVEMKLTRHIRGQKIEISSPMRQLGCLQSRMANN